MAIKCYHCSGKHALVADVKECSTTKIPAAFAAPAPVEAVKVTVPAHRTSAKYLALKAQVAPVPAHEPIAPFTPAETKIMTSPVVSTIKTGQDLELGMYQTVDANGVITVYKVTTGKHSSYKQAQKLWISQKDFFNQETQQWDAKPVGKFYFAKGMMNVLTSENKMSEADAKAFHDATKKKYGVDYGFCCVCGKLLTVKKSIDAGIGPVCAGKL